MIMKKSIVLVFCAFLSVQASNASTLADWTFESSSVVPYAPGVNTPTTNFYAELGSDAGTAAAFGLHAGSATYSSVLGNGSLESLSSTAWAKGDYYQFSVALDLIDNTYSGIKVSFDQNGSTTGPKTFYLAYSRDGLTFTEFGSDYVIPSGVSWNGSTPNHSTQFSDDLSSITALNVASVLYFRIVDDSPTAGGAINGNNVGTGGTDRVDNFTVNATVTPTPEPSPFALVAFGCACLMAVGRWR